MLVDCRMFQGAKCVLQNYLMDATKRMAREAGDFQYKVTQKQVLNAALPCQELSL
jgi:hypothetical protein